MPMVALHWEKYFQHIMKKYNKIYKIQMPKVTPHVCRQRNSPKIPKNKENTVFIISYNNMIKILFVCHGRNFCFS